MNESWRHSRHRDAALPSRASLAFSFQHLGKNSYKICSKDTTEGGAVCLIWGTANNMDKKFRFKLFRWLSVYFGQYFTCPSICLGRHIYEIRYCLLGRNFNISILSLTEVKMLTQRKISIVFLMPCSFPKGTTIPVPQITGQRISLVLSGWKIAALRPAASKICAVLEKGGYCSCECCALILNEF